MAHYEQGFYRMVMTGDNSCGSAVMHYDYIPNWTVNTIMKYTTLIKIKYLFCHCFSYISHH